MDKLKTFADECEELGEFRKSYMKKHSLKRLGMNEACLLWREHQGDIAAKDKLIVDSVNNAARYKEALEDIIYQGEGFEIYAEYKVDYMLNRAKAMLEQM